MCKYLHVRIWRKINLFSNQIQICNIHTLHKQPFYDISTASRCILVPFEWYGCPIKCTQKVWVAFFLYIFQVKNKWNTVYEYIKTKIFSRDTNILPQTHWTSNIFRHPDITILVFWVSLNYLILNFKKTVFPKNV